MHEVYCNQRCPSINTGYLVVELASQISIVNNTYLKQVDSLTDRELVIDTLVLYTQISAELYPAPH